MKKLVLFMLCILFAGIQVVNAQVKNISGTVTSAEDGSPIPGVSVIVKGTTVGTITNIDGYFRLDVPQESNTLIFSFVGMKSMEKTISGTTVNAVLQPDVLGLDEVMVVAFGTAKKSTFTGSADVVGAEELESRTITSVTQALEGTTTGVQVTSSGQPGSEPEIRIRGFGTLNGVADPLYIVDGAQYEGSIASIDPDDIESMTILKDASSTALYGARAANGVVLITTKSGRQIPGEIKVNVKAVGGVIGQAIPYYETADPKQYYELMYQAYKNSLIYSEDETPADAAQMAASGIYDRLNYNPFNVANDQIVDANGNINPGADVIYKSLNWYEPLEQTGYRQNYNISASGGGEKHDVYMSLGYLDERGYVIDSDYERINARMNANFNPTEWLSFGTNFYGTLTERGLASATTGNTSYANPFYFARQMGSIYPVYLVDPQTGDFILDAAGEKQYDLGGGYNQYGINSRPAAANPGRHIVAEMDYNNNITNTNNLGNRSHANITLFDGLELSTTYGIDIQNYKDSEFENQIVGDGAPSGRYNQTRFIRTVQNWVQTLNYELSVGEGHDFAVLLGHETFDREYTEVYGMKTQLIVEGIYEFDNFVTPTSLDGYTSNKKTEGYFSRLNYNFMDKYYLSGSFRRDGSSVFQKDVRWGNFYSVGASWRMDQEQFIQNIDWINVLKIRASYGEVGNDNLGDFYAYQALYSTFPNAEAPGLRWSDVGNSELTWESSNSFDAAVEFGLFDRVTGSLEYYKKISEDLLYDQPLALSMGLDVQPRNIASLYNSGWEFGIDAKLVASADFTWDLGLQMSTVKNEITDIPEPFVNGSKRWAVGHSVYDYYLYDFYGVDPETGATLYRVWEENEDGTTSPASDENGEPLLSEQYTDSEKGYTGDSAIPDLLGSVSNTFRYKNFQLDFLVTYGVGGKILDYNYANLMNEGDYGDAVHVDLMNGWRNPGDQTDIPRMEYGNSNLTYTLSDRWLTDASYVTLKNINLSYTFSKNAAQSIGVNSLRLFAAGENLYMLTARKGMDPQEAFSGTTSNVYLPQRVFSLGVNVSF